ncbi:MAG: cupin domain-containing protein [Actinobacteria bacterium]|nr:MAG: cupin domain-containing protein [Actinomycetota bacterium]
MALAGEGVVSVGVRVTRGAAANDQIMRGLFAAENCPHPRKWSGGSGQTYDWHTHGYHKVLFCLAGEIVFQDREGLNYRVGAGDRLDVEAGTEHSAVAGSDGVECMESFK